MERKATPELSIRFTQLLLELYGHEKIIEFDLMTLDYEKVRCVLEAADYSVHLDSRFKQSVVAYRVEPDRAPILPESTFVVERQYASLR